MSLLGIDLGTTGCKAGVFGLDGACIAQAYREYDMLHPQPGWSELDSSNVWKKTREVIAEVAAQSKHDPVTALSIGSFGEAVVPVSNDRKILDNSIPILLVQSFPISRIRERLPCVLVQGQKALTFTN